MPMTAKERVQAYRKRLQAVMPQRPPPLRLSAAERMRLSRERRRSGLDPLSNDGASTSATAAEQDMAEPTEIRPFLHSNMPMREKDHVQAYRNWDIQCGSTSDNTTQAVETVENESMKSPTTNRPFITVIKPEDSKTDEPESVSSDEFCEDASINKSSSNVKFNPNALPSPYKHLPFVSVCLKEEDRLIAQKELGKSVKRSSSICSNSSNGSNEVNKPSPTPKRRKVDKPAPTVIGRQNDCYCWVCHRENITLCCIACPRAFHQKCSGDSTNIPDWVCPECKRILHAENVDSRSSVLSEISLDKLCTLLKFSLNKMKHRAGVAFHQPVSLEHYPMYPHYVIHSMDFSLLEKNIKQKLYGCTEAFLADVKWILHNSCVFNGTQHPLSTNAKSMVKTCENDMQEIEVCPDCFMHSAIRNKYWFSDVCRKPHPLVWAKLKGFPYWPAKVVRIVDGNVDARFFGAHDRAWVPINQCYHLSKEMPTSSKPKKKGNYETALDELNVHVHLLIQKFGSFEYAQYRTIFDPENKAFLYHGIDIDTVDKEEIPFDSTSAIRNECGSSPKETEKSIESKINYDLFESPAKTVDEFDSYKTSSKEVETRNAFNLQRQSVTINLFKDKNEIENSNEPSSKSLTQDKNTPESSKLNAIEKALERIKGYVSVNDEDATEKDDVDNSIETIEEPKTGNTESNVVKQSGSSFLAGLIKSKPLPSLDIPSIPIEESPEDAPVHIVDTTRKSDSFSLKLIETIESCKAKLGISGSDLNESIDSDSVEDEEDDDEEDDEDEEGEEMEQDGDKEHEGVENEKEANNANSNVSDEETSDGDSSDSDESGSVSSDTDIEAVDDDSGAVHLKKNPTNDSAPAENNSVSEENKISNDSRTIIEDCTNAAQNSDEVHGADKFSKGKICNRSDTTENNLSGNVSDHEKDLARVMSDEENDHTENEMDDENDRAKNMLDAENDHSKNISGDENDYTEHSSDDEKDRSKTVSDDAVSHKERAKNSLKNNERRMLTPKQDMHTTKSPVKKHLVETHPSNSNVLNNARNLSTAADGNDEDDDIFICNSPPPKPPTPPLICLDDGTETEPEDKSTQKLQSVQDFGNPLPKMNEKHRLSFKKMDSTDCALQDVPNKPSVGTVKLPTNARKSIKRVFKSVSSRESSDDDILLVPTPKRVPLTGAKRTFTNRLQTSTAKKTKPIDETSSASAIASSDINSKDLSLNKMDAESVLDNNNSSDHSANVEQEALADVMNQSCVSEPTSSSEDKDAEILKLRKKLSGFFNAYQLQHSKHAQEKAELRHNMNLIVMEMRASLEADKKHAIETLSRTLEREKVRCVEEAKKKQWCACCLQESRYACCWNTSYCTLSCQKRHFTAHRKFCTQLKAKPVPAERLEAKTTDAKEGKKVLVLNVLPKADVNKSSSDSHQPTIQQIPFSKVVSPKTPIQLVPPTVTNINSAFQFMFSPLKPDDSSALQSKPATTKENIDSAECVVNKDSGITTSLSKETSLYKKTNDPVGETSLEEIYFPSPPTVSFEGLDTALPDENVHFSEPDDNSESHPSDAEQASGDKVEESSGEEDVLLSENDETDNELISLGHGIDVKAKFLNKCLIYGKTAKRLTRCLVDVLFPDLKLLANCSAFGNKSNVTKLTRAALPSRKVASIIDYVLKRFPDGSKTEIVLAINMKCKEARNIIRKAGTDGVVKKPLFRRLLAKEQKQEINSVNPNDALTITKISTPVASKVQKVVAKIPQPPLVPVLKTTTTNTFNTPTTFTVLRKAIPNIVCVKNSTSGPNLTTSTQLMRPKTAQTNVLRYNPQVLIQPKPVGSKTQTRFLIPSQTNMPAKGAHNTVRSILTRAQGNPSREEGKILLPLNFIKKAPDVLNPPDASKNQNKASSQRPCIVIGARASPSSASQKSTYSTSAIKRK